MMRALLIGLALAIFFALRRRVFAAVPTEGAQHAPDNRALAFALQALWLVAITAGRWMAYVGEASEFASLAFGSALPPWLAVR